MVVTSLCVLLVYYTSVINSANILGVFTTLTHSHHIVGKPIMEALAKRGHNVTFINMFEEEDGDNIQRIALRDIEEKLVIGQDLWESHKLSMIEKSFDTLDSYKRVSIRTLNHTKFKSFVDSTSQKFDVIILEHFCNLPLLALSYVFKAPIILVETSMTPNIIKNMIGIPAPASYVTDPKLSFKTPMTFWERMYNGIHVTWNYIFERLLLLPEMDSLMHTYFPEAPTLDVLKHNISLVLTNSHYSTNPVIPMAPNLIEIGGVHITPVKSLPLDLKEYLDNASEGVIYFSMGSNLKITELPDQKRRDILSALSKLKEKVLWKWENDTLPEQPENVKLGKWFPQQDILAHPNVKLFISHGGLLSTIEAVHYGVPILGIPVYADQHCNMNTAYGYGYGLSIPFVDLNEEKLSSALQEILLNPKYRKEAKVRSQIMHDRALKPLDTAVFWVEYVLRHNGANHLKSVASDLKWYEYYMLDVVGLCSATVFLFVYFVHISIKHILYVIMLYTMNNRYISKNISSKIKKKN